MNSARLTYSVTQCNLVPTNKNAAPEKYGAKDSIPTNDNIQIQPGMAAFDYLLSTGGQKMSASSNFGAGRLLKSITAIAVLAIFSASVSAQELQPIEQPDKFKTDVHIVLLRGNPVVAYEGEIKGMNATKPAKGKKINPHSKAVKKYVG